MTLESLVHARFVDGASCHTLNLASAAWVIYEPSGQLSSFGSTCLGPLTNNITEYSVIIELLLDAISHGIQHMVVHLDSQLVVLQLNGHYRVRNSSILFVSNLALVSYGEILDLRHRYCHSQSI